LKALASGAALLSLALLLDACAAAPQALCASGLRTAVLDQLYFGTSRTHAAPVSEQEWQQFVQEEVAPRLPRGYTVLDAQGQWRGVDGGIVQERTHLLQWVHADDAAGDGGLRQIIQCYKAQFSQEAVLQIRSPACVAP
jgi:hypothetical protein